MRQAELSVQQSIELLIGQDRERLLRPALRIAAKQRARDILKEKREALAHIRHYERRYGMPLAEFEHKKLRQMDTRQAHEDYNDCFLGQAFLIAQKKRQQRSRPSRPLNERGRVG